MDEFAARARRFIGVIGAAHPGKPVFCIDLFTCDSDLGGDGNNKAAAFRKVVRRLVRESGRPNLVYVAGDRMLQSVAGLTADLVHPSPHGMEEMARNLSAVIRRTRVKPA